jgi:general secretion pathway protein G
VTKVVLGAEYCVLREVNDVSSRLTPRASRLTPPATQRAFTLVELLVVMAIVALLMSIAVPRYFHSIDRAREAVLKENLLQMRDAVDKFYGDRGRYPDTLEDLVSRKYLRRIPPDPMTDSAMTWQVVAPQETGIGLVFDVKSGAEGQALDGSRYGDW